MEFLHGIWRSITFSDALPLRSGFRGELQNRFGMAQRYVSSFYGRSQDNGALKSIRSYCMFVGHARSGGSLVGALLDAHPNIILADEVDALKYVSAGFTREQIYHLLLDRSQYQATRGKTKAGRDAQKYSYQVPGQWQGRFDRLLVIGDRKAGKSTQRLGQDPGLLDALRKTMGKDQVKLVHVIRNPYDTLSTMHLRSGREIDNGIELYFSNCAAIQHLREKISTADMFTLRHEDFLECPERYLQQICEFLSISADADYIESCARILYKSPAKTRQKVAWGPESIQAVKSRIDEFEFLQGYRFED
jgi:hypothetical protein